MSLLASFKLSVKKHGLGVYGVHVYQNGKTIAEHRFRSDDKVNIYSASKTFTSVGIGIAEQEGLFNLSDYVLDFFPEYKSIASAGSEKISIYHLLQMSSGHMVDNFNPDNRQDGAELFFTTEMKQDAGSQFFYEELSTYMLGRIVEKVSGDKMVDYLKPRLFELLEIENPQWNTCWNGHTVCACGLHLKTEEFSRLGITLLQKGLFLEKQIVPAGYVDRMHMNWIDTSSKNDTETREGYGFQVWKCTPANAYRASGKYGQFTVVLSDYNAVVTITSHNENDQYDILRAVWNDIIPNL